MGDKTAENYRLLEVDEKHDATMLCCQHCYQLSTILFSIIEPESARV
jgi:hypothetical protein